METIITTDFIDCQPTGLWKKFIDGAGKLGITPEELITEYKYAGGNWNQHEKYYIDHYSYLYRPQDTSYCLCDTEIKHNAYISNGKRIVVAGSCCIKRFLPTGMSRTCELCGGVHKNRKDNICNSCRAINKEQAIKQRIIDKSPKCVDCKTIIHKKYTRCYRCFAKHKHMN